jgi:hypothetical protein
MKSLNQKTAILAVLVLVANAAFAGTYGGGCGTEAMPYQIGKLGDWQELMTTSGDWNAHFELTANLDFGGLSVIPVGDGTRGFRGVFDGQGHVIRNAVINLPSSNDVGLFGNVDGGQIRNLGVENVNVTGGGSVGGVVGCVSNSDIINCYATGVVNGGGSVGGLVGYKGHGVIASCYARCAVTGNGRVGGLIGYISAPGGTTSDCYASGAVSGNGEAGGLAGGNYAGMITACFWDAETSGQPSNELGKGIPTASMQDPETYLRALWDFEGEIKNGLNDTWAMPQGGGYPVLAWQLGESPVSNDEMGDAIALVIGTAVSGTSVGARGVDITRNGYNDSADVWYYFDCTETDKYTIRVEPEDYNSSVAVFDERQTEIVFNDDFFGGKSVVILRAVAGRRYYVRVGGLDGQTGDFVLAVEQGAIQAIQGDLNYDGVVGLQDLAIMAENWVIGN